METTHADERRHGRPLQRNRRGHEGGGQLFIARRQRDFTHGLMSEKGHSNEYLVFRPSRLFVRTLGDGVLRLNDALADFRSQAVDHVLLLGGDDMQTHYAELERRIQAVRDRVFDLTAYCNQGFDGQFTEAVEGVEAAAAEGADGAAEAESERPAALEPAAAIVGAKPDATDVDVFEALRQRNVDQGILTELGRDQGYVAFRPSTFYGRFVSEIAYTLNDAMRRMEGQTSFYIVDGQGEPVRRYYRELENGLAALGRDLDGIIDFCQRRVA